MFGVRVCVSACDVRLILCVLCVGFLYGFACVFIYVWCEFLFDVCICVLCMARFYVCGVRLIYVCVFVVCVLFVNICFVCNWVLCLCVVIFVPYV